MRKVILLMALMTIHLASAIDVSIDVPDSFREGEQIYFNYTILSEEDMNITLMRGVNCPDAPTAPLEIKSLELKAGVPVDKRYRDIYVTGDLEPQECVAYVYIEEPEFAIANEIFSIDVLPGFNFSVKACRTPECENEFSTFIPNDIVFITYVSDMENIDVVSHLQYPDGRNGSISLPAEISVEEIGIYILYAEAFSEGRKDTSSSKSFTVIEDYPSVRIIGSCDGDGICSGGENSQKCPQDCRYESVPETSTAHAICIVSAIILIPVSIIFARRRKKS